MRTTAADKTKMPLTLTLYSAFSGLPLLIVSLQARLIKGVKLFGAAGARARAVLSID